MGDTSKQLVEQAGIIQQLKLMIQLEEGGTKPTGPHTVKLLEEKAIMGNDPMTGKEREEIKWIFEENGAKKYYKVPIKNKEGELHYLIQRMAEVNIGDEIILEAKKKGIKNYIDLQKNGNTLGDEFPTIEEGTATGEKPLIDDEGNPIPF